MEASVPESYSRGLASARVVVIGAGGAIGRRLLARLVDSGAELTAVDICPTPSEMCLEGVNYITADVSGAGDALPAVLQGADIVYHLAYLMGEEANQDPVSAARVNTLGGTKIMRGCVEAGVGRLLLASSVTVFGSQRDYSSHDLPLCDNAAQHGAKGVSVYAAGKIYLERVADFYTRRHGLCVGGLRPGAVIGSSRSTGRAKAVANIVAEAAKGNMVSVPNGRAAFQAIHIDDVVGAFLALAMVKREIFADMAFFNLAGDYATLRSYCENVAEMISNSAFEISDGESDELFGSAPFVLDDGIHRRVGFSRRYRTLREAIKAELQDIYRAPAH